MPAKKAPAPAPVAAPAAKTAPAKTAPVKTAPAKTAPAKTAPVKTPATPRAKTPAKAAAVATEWKSAELAEIKATLEKEAVELTHELEDANHAIDEAREAGSDGTGDDQADAGSATFEREQGMSLAANHRDMLVQTERALSRIEDGTYGACENCGKPIGVDRLQAFPRATLCKECKQREERR